MRRDLNLLLGICITLSGAPAAAQSVLTPQQAEEMLTDPAGPPAPAAGDDCVLRLPNGSCARQPKDSRQAVFTSRPSSPGGTQVGRELPIRFLLGSFELSDQSKENIRTLVAALTSPQNRDKAIRIEGHTDRSGSAALNDELSLKRAQAVADYMSTLGVQPDRVEVKGYGYRRLLPGIAPTDPRNRRVEVVRTR